MSIKVLHIITQLELGGAQKNVLQILAGLDQQKYDIYLISSRGLLDEEAKNIPHLHLKFLSFLKRQPNPIFDVLAFIFLIFFIKNKKIHIVHTHSSKAGILGRWAARFSGVPVIIHTIHGWGFHDHGMRFLNKFYIFLEKCAAKISKKLIAVSENDIRMGLKEGIGSREQYALIRCSLEPGFLSGKQESAEYYKTSFKIENHYKVAGMVACLKKQKNPLDFVRAADCVLNKNPHTKFLLIGDGVGRSRIESEIKKRQLQDNIFLLGWRKDVKKIMACVDVFVLTSLWEGLPVVLLEAMGCSKPIVAYDVGGVREVVKDGINGFLVKPKDFKELSIKVNLILENDELRHRMGACGQRLALSEEFSHDHMMKQIQRLYEDSLMRP